MLRGSLVLAAAHGRSSRIPYTTLHLRAQFGGAAQSTDARPRRNAQAAKDGPVATQPNPHFGHGGYLARQVALELHRPSRAEALQTPGAPRSSGMDAQAPSTDEARGQAHSRVPRRLNCGHFNKGSARLCQQRCVVQHGGRHAV